MASLTAKLTHMVVVEGNPDGAINLLLGRYDPIADAKRFQSMFFRARRLMLKDESNRRVAYLSQIRDLQASLDPSNTADRERLEGLLGRSLLQQMQIYSSKKQILSDAIAQRRLEDISPAIQVICDFKMPEEITKEAGRLTRETLSNRMFHRDDRTHTMNLVDLQKYIQIAKTTIARPIIKSRDYYCHVVAMGLLCGRRQFEIVSTLEWEAVPGYPYQAKIYGLCKNIALDVGSCGNASAVIPLLCTYDDFDRAMNKIRDFREVNGESDDTANTAIGVACRAKCKSLFGRNLSHTEKRNIYVEMAFRDKENSGFLPQCSKSAWVVSALCHDPSFKTSDPYTALNIL